MELLRWTGRTRARGDVISLIRPVPEGHPIDYAEVWRQF
jgi:hypothetical protein